MICLIQLDDISKIVDSFQGKITLTTTPGINFINIE